MAAGAYLQYLVVSVFLVKFYDAAVVAGYFCKDPDTEIFHAVNTTWQSTTFCGNYTCKLRKKNTTHFLKNDTEGTESIKDKYEKLRLNINNETKVHDENEKNVTNVDGSKEEKVESIVKMNNNFKSDDTRGKSETTEDGNDRYLTEDEIKTISSILHSVKKSDLDAIVEIYNLAKDIYKDMDTATTENHLAITTIQGKQEHNIAEPNISPKYPYQTSWPAYWYTSTPQSTQPKINTPNSIVGQKPKPCHTKNVKDTTNFFSREQAAKKIPFYYPMSSFQRMSSYIYDPYVQQRQNPPQPSVPQVAPEQKTPQESAAIAPWVNRIVKKPFTIDNYQRIYTPALLAYPYSYINHYNLTYPSDKYFNGRQWNPVNHFSNNYGVDGPPSRTFRHEEDVSDNYNVNDVKSAGEVIPEKSNLINSLFNYPAVEIDSNEGAPGWKTPQISAPVLEEVRANWGQEPLSLLGDIKNNILERSVNTLKSMTQKKGMKLEKVAKLLRLDHNRSKRHTEDDTQAPINVKELDEAYEPYLVTKICETATEPGFFRVGNLSEPYPHCCPQRIERR